MQGRRSTMLRLDMRWGMAVAVQWLRVNRMGMLFAMVVLLAGCTPSQPPPGQAVDLGGSLSENQRSNIQAGSDQVVDEGGSLLENELPNVQAGPDQAVDLGGSVTLRGIASDPAGSVQTYRWEQMSGTSVSIANASQASASFTAPQVSGSEELTFRLTVADTDGASASDEVAVTVADYGRLEVALSGNVKHHSTIPPQSVEYTLNNCPIFRGHLTDPSLSCLFLKVATHPVNTLQALNALM